MVLSDGCDCVRTLDRYFFESRFFFKRSRIDRFNDFGDEGIIYHKTGRVSIKN